MKTDDPSSLDRSKPCKKAHSREDAYQYTRTWTSRKTGETRPYEVLVCRTCIRENAARSYERNHGRNPHPPAVVPDDQLKVAYAAGLFDGEGSVMIRLTRDPRESNTVRCDHHGLIISVSSTNTEVVEWLQFHFGGRVNAHRPRSAERRSAFTWRLLSRHAEAFLRAVLPYLIIKKPQAELAIKLRETMGIGRTTLVTDELFAYREQLRQQVKALNQRGAIPEGAIG